MIGNYDKLAIVKDQRGENSIGLNMAVERSPCILHENQRTASKVR